MLAALEVGPANLEPGRLPPTSEDKVRVAADVRKLYPELGANMVRQNECRAKLSDTTSLART